MSRSTPEEKAAIEMAQALLGSMAQQPPDLPPPVQATPPPPAAAQQAQPAAQVPRDNVDEIKDDPPPSATSEQKAQSTDAVPPRHRLLQRLLRALPIASPAQLTAMINVFDPNRDALLAPPPPATAPPQNPGTATTQPQSYPGGLPHTAQQTPDPLHHLLAQPSLKRLGLTPIITNYTDICISNMPTQTTSDQDIFTIRHGNPGYTICLAYADLCSGNTAYSTDWIRSSSRYTRSPQLDC